LSSDDRASRNGGGRKGSFVTRSCGGYYPLTRNEEQKTLC
jgi:hypothetical protein